MECSKGIRWFAVLLVGVFSLPLLCAYAEPEEGPLRRHALVRVDTPAGESETPPEPAYIIIDDFSAYKELNTFPYIDDPQRWRSLSLLKPFYYKVKEKAGNKFLKALIPKDGISRKKKAITLIKRIYKGKTANGKIKFYDPEEYPVLSWRWCVHKFPKGSDEEVENENVKKNDSAAGVYIYFQKHGQGPNIIKFIWSETKPVGKRFLTPSKRTEFEDMNEYRPRIVVLRSGRKGLGKWFTESVDLIDEFKKAFPKKKKAPRILGIGILTDADSTNQSAEADYDDFILRKR